MKQTHIIWALYNICMCNFINMHNLYVFMCLLKGKLFN